MFMPYPKDIVLLDTETTGTDTHEGHEAIQLAAVRLDAATLREKATFASRIRPLTPERANPRAMEIHGISLDELAQAPTPSEVAQAFEEAMFTPEERASPRALSGAVMLAAHNAKFDWEFLRQIAKRGGMEGDRWGYHMLCTWSTAVDRCRMLGITPPRGSHSLSNLAEMFNLPRADRHDALEDCRVAAEVLRRLDALLIERVRGVQAPSEGARVAGRSRR